MSESLSLPDAEVKEVVRNMAEILQTEVSEDGAEICLEIPEHMGSGTIRAFTLDHGLGVLDVDCMLKEPVPFRMDNRRIQPLKILFNRETQILHHFDGADERHEIGHQESCMLSCNMKHGHVFEFPANKPVCIFSLEINRKLFEPKIDEFLSETNGDLEDVFRDVNGVNLFYFKANYSLDSAKFIEEFLSSDLDGFMRVVYQEGKAYEILSHYLQQYRDVHELPEDSRILRQRSVKRIQQAVDIIREEIDQQISVADLAKRVGLNRNTLQQGFKTLHKMSVNDFVRQERIERAKELMETTDLNITEITYKIGINSRSYFSKMFREKYGISPKQYLDNRRKTTS